jgi:hypothetical protein
MSAGIGERLAVLRARLDEDERVALAIKDDGYGDNDGDGWKRWVIEEREGGNSWPYMRALGVELAHSYADNVLTPQRGEHVARWDPARVLAEVAIKRRILDELEALQHYAWDGRPEYGCPKFEDRQTWRAVWGDRPQECTCGRDAHVERMVAILSDDAR